MAHEIEVIEQSVVRGAPMITTVKLRYWRPIHAEVMTHRAFSRNASSSRAVPVAKLAETSADSMFVPKFRKNRPGMQPGEYLSEEEQAEADHVWTRAAHACYQAAMELSRKDGLNVHKQWANRMLEWFGYINVLITATEWYNFFELRIASDEDGWPIPQDEMFQLAVDIQHAVNNSVYRVLGPGQWHLPFVTAEDRKTFTLEQQKKISAARCASISYETVDGKPMTAEKAIDLCDKLMTRKHWSPFEHQAMADAKIEGKWAHESLHANYVGWAQWRHFLMEQS